jgi:hypothetical protein
MPTYQDRLRAIPGAVRALIVLPFLLAGLGLGAYWVWTYSGLYRWMVEGQGALFGSYVQPWTEIFAVLIAVLLGLLPAALILYVVNRLEVFPVPPDAGSGPTPAAAAADQWIRAHKYRLLGAGLGLMGLVGGGVIWLHGYSAGPLTDLRAADLEAGGAPASGWVRARGRPLWDRRIEFEVNEVYVPVVSERWKPGDKVALFVRPNGPLTLVAAPVPPPLDGDGTLVIGGLPGPARTDFEKAGLPPAEHHQVVSMGWRPDNEMALGGPLFGAGLILLLLTGGVWALLALRDRQQRRAAP